MVPVIGRFTTIKQVSCTQIASSGTNAHWLFLPFSGTQGPRRVWNLNQDLQVGPEYLFSTSSQTLQKIVADMLVVFQDNLNKDKNPPSMMHVDHFNSILILLTYSARPTHVTRIPSGRETGSFLALTLTDTDL